MLRFLASLILSGVDKLNSIIEPYKDINWGTDLPVKPEEVDITLEAKEQTISDNIINKFLYCDKTMYYNHLNGQDMGDMCIWHGVWSAYLSNKVNTYNAFQGLHNLLYGSGKTRLLRGYGKFGEFKIAIGNEKYFGDDPKNPGYMFKQEASLDSLIGYCYGLTYLKKYASDAVLKTWEIDKLCNDLYESINQFGGWLTNPKDDSHTEYGDLRIKMTQSPIRILAMLLVMKLAGKEKEYNSAYIQCRPLIPYGETHLLGLHPWFQDHLAVIAYDALLELETDKAKVEKYYNGLKRMFDKTAKQGNLLFYGIYGKHSKRLGKEIDNKIKLYTVKGLLDYPIEKPKQVTNSTDPSITKVKFAGELQSAHALLPSKRAPSDYMWQRKPYSLDGQDNDSYNGLDYLMALMQYKLWEK